MIVANLSNISLHIPIYNYGALSIKDKFLHFFRENKILRENKIQRNRYIIKIILNNINLKINKGDRIGVIGANGSGKTSLLKIISSVYFPTTGSIILRNQVTSILDITLGIYGEATGVENISLRAMILGLDQKKVKEKIHEIIEISGLSEEVINQPLFTYSSGMAMRLAFAVSMILEPELLVLDEWLAVGDYEFQKTVNKNLEIFIKKTKALIFASHDLEQIKKICNRVIIMKEGLIFFDGKPSEAVKIYTNEK